MEVTKVMEFVRALLCCLLMVPGLLGVGHLFCGIVMSIRKNEDALFKNICLLIILITQRP